VSKYYAVARETDEIIAQGQTYFEVMENAEKVMPWGANPKGEVAPYLIMKGFPHIEEQAKAVKS
jgi:hypothetical protein